VLGRVFVLAGRRRRHPFLAALLCTLGSLVAVQGAASAASGMPEVRIASGSIGATVKWTASVRRGLGASGASQPCIRTELGAVSNRAVLGTETLCGPVEEAQIVEADSAGSGDSERTVLGLAFPSRARTVRLWIAGRPARQIPLQRLSAFKAQKAGVIRFRFAVIGLAGPFCLRRFDALDGEGRVVSDGRQPPCE
jgi:hypothetical protein